MNCLDVSSNFAGILVRWPGQMLFGAFVSESPYQLRLSCCFTSGWTVPFFAPLPRKSEPSRLYLSSCLWLSLLVGCHCILQSESSNCRTEGNSDQSWGRDSVYGHPWRFVTNQTTQFTEWLMGCLAASLLKGLKHANIVTLHDIVHTKETLTFVFEYVVSSAWLHITAGSDGVPDDFCRGGPDVCSPNCVAVHLHWWFNINVKFKVVCVFVIYLAPQSWPIFG